MPGVHETWDVHAMPERRQWSPRHGLVGVSIALLFATSAWWVWRRRAGARIAAAEARLEPQPVVY